jgi:hypothetical protein
MGKGSKRRPRQCDRGQYETNWNDTFGGKSPKKTLRWFPKMDDESPFRPDKDEQEDEEEPE